MPNVQSQSKPEFRRRSLEEKRDFARDLRKRPSLADQILWEHLRQDKLGVRFRRRSVVMGWIPNFYCPSHKIAVFIPSRLAGERESLRDVKMTNAGIRVLQVEYKDAVYSTGDVMGRIRGVIGQAAGVRSDFRPKVARPEAYGKVTSRQIEYIECLLIDVGMGARSARNEWLTAFLDREVRFLDELTSREADRVIKELRRIKEEE